MNVLSLFDGISCGRVALERAGIKVDKYYASEIDKYAIQIAQKNYPDTIQLGDVKNISVVPRTNYLILPDDEATKIDLLIGGSPCQGFSFAGKQLNFEDPRSKLFFEFVRLLKELKPKYFLLENVRMKQEYQDIISEHLGVKPIMINSALVSAQNRVRLYWTNIPGIKQPEDKGIMLKDIVHEFRYGENELKLFVPEATKKGYCEVGEGECVDISFMSSKTRRGRLMKNKSNTLTATNYDYCLLEKLKEYIVPFDKTLKILEKEVEKGKVGYFRKDSQANRVYFIHDKAITLCGDAGSGTAKMGKYLFRTTKKNSQGDRVYSMDEKSPTMNASSGVTAGNGSALIGIVNKPRGNNKGGLRNNGEKSPTMSSNSWEHNNHLLFGCITPDRIEKRQNGQRFSDSKKFYTLTAQDKHGILIEGYIRKLTPIECCRLQTLPDFFTAFGINEHGEEVKISNSQQYKCLGNGWTADVITHILKNIK